MLVCTYKLHQLRPGPPWCYVMLLQLMCYSTMNVTSFVISFVNICCLLTGTRTWMVSNAQHYQLLLDTAFWITWANLVGCSLTLRHLISYRSSELVLQSVIRFFLLAVSATGAVVNLATRRKRHVLESASSHLLVEYGRFPRLFILFIPVSSFTVLINTVAFNKDKTFMFVMLNYSPSIFNESYMNLKTLAIAHRFDEVASALSQMDPSNADRTISSAMEAHRDCSKLIEMVNGCHKLDYFLLSSTCLIHTIYAVIGVFQDVKNGKAAFDGKYAIDMTSTFLYFVTVTGRFFLTCWSGTHLTLMSESCLEAALNYKFYHYGKLKQKSKDTVDMFIHQLQERTKSLSVLRMFDLGLGTFTTFVEVTLTYAIVVVNTIGAKTVAQLASDSENTTQIDVVILQDQR